MVDPIHPTSSVIESDSRIWKTVRFFSHPNNFTDKLMMFGQYIEKLIYLLNTLGTYCDSGHAKISGVFLLAGTLHFFFNSFGVRIHAWIAPGYFVKLDFVTKSSIWILNKFLQKSFMPSTRCFSDRCFDFGLQALFMAGYNKKVHLVGE